MHINTPWTKTNKYPEPEYPQTKNNLKIIQINILHVNMICTIQERTDLIPTKSVQCLG